MKAYFAWCPLHGPTLFVFFKPFGVGFNLFRCAWRKCAVMQAKKG